MNWEDQLEASAAAAHAEMKAMVESANRSIGQRFRYLRERLERQRLARMSFRDLQRAINMARSAQLEAIADVQFEEVYLGIYPLERSSNGVSE